MNVHALPQDVVDTAIAWAVRLDYNDAAEDVRAAFSRWLQSDPSHALAWQRVESLRQPFAAVPPQIVRGTLEAADVLRERRTEGRRGALKLLSAAGLSLGAGWIAREHAPWQRLLADVSTATGEQKTLRLADGTVILLNTDSAVSADMTSERRVVAVRRGEVLITTGKDAQSPLKRPFWVETPYGRMQALGTRFTVRLAEDGARVSVQEGAVELHPAAGGASHVVSPDESRWLRHDRTEPADLRGFEADGWSDGVIAGKNIRLGDLLDELARYRTGRIEYDRRVADLRLSGLFHVRNTDQALQFLVQTQPISVRMRTRFWVLVGPEEKD